MLYSKLFVFQSNGVSPCLNLIIYMDIIQMVDTNIYKNMSSWKPYNLLNPTLNFEIMVH
jgi:hypothetical protein